MTLTTTERRLWWLARSAPPSVLRRGRSASDGYVQLEDTSHMVCDGPAALHMYSALAPCYGFAGTLLNLPPNVYGPDGPAFGPCPELGPGDIVLQTARPPLDDDCCDRRPLERSGSELEQRILGAQRRFFEHCSRDTVILSEAVSRLVPVGPGRSRRAMKFNIYGNATVVRYADTGDRSRLWSSARRRTRRTAGYLLYIPSIEPGGPALLTSFGLNGTANLLWNHFLSTSFRELLDTCLDSTRPRVVVALFQSTFHGDLRPQYVGSGVSPEVEILIDVTL